MAADQAPVKFIRKNGRIIPIRAAALGARATRSASHVAAAAGTAAALHRAVKNRHEPAVEGNKAMKFGSEALSVAGGALSGATLGHGMKGFALGHAASFAIDTGATALGAGAFIGKGHTQERARGAARQELKNQAIGWTSFGAAALAVPASRKRIAEYATKILAFGRKALGVV